MVTQLPEFWKNGINSYDPRIWIRPVRTKSPDGFIRAEKKSAVDIKPMRIRRHLMMGWVILAMVGELLNGCKNRAVSNSIKIVRIVMGYIYSYFIVRVKCEDKYLKNR
jgi:hypothetical protein